MAGWYDSLSFDEKVAFQDRCRDWMEDYNKREINKGQTMAKGKRGGRTRKLANKERRIKHKLRCRLFGHDFRKFVSERVLGPFESLKIYEPSDHCMNCGLSKKEINETNKKII